MKKMIVALIVMISSAAFGSNKLIEVSVDLFPAGSFVAKTSKIKGKLIFKKDGSLQGKNIRALVKYFETGIELRDEHFKKRLGYEANKKASVDLVALDAKDGKGSAKFKVNGIEQETAIKYKKVDDKVAEAEFELDLTKFKIEGISYLGVGVEDVIKVKVKMPYFVE